MSVDPLLFSEVADALGIGDPIIVEKDFYAVLLIKELSRLNFDDYQLVFAGGTCLTKVHQNTYRMSEDIDLKLVASEKILNESKNKQRLCRKFIHQKIVSMLESSPIFQLPEPPKKRNEHKFQQFLIQYPRHHPLVDSLRPHLQLEITESILLEPAISKPIASLYAETIKADHEISLFPCVTINITASEKFVSLLRRTAAFIRDNTQADDETLIRHVYDLHLIHSSLNYHLLKPLIEQVIQIDVKQFGNQHEAFRDNPNKELMYGLKLLTENPIYKDRYQRFIGPLVYHRSPTTWEHAIKTIVNMATECLD